MSFEAPHSTSRRGPPDGHQRQRVEKQECERRVRQVDPEKKASRQDQADSERGAAPAPGTRRTRCHSRVRHGGDGGPDAAVPNRRRGLESPSRKPHRDQDDRPIPRKRWLISMMSRFIRRNGGPLPGSAPLPSSCPSEPSDLLVFHRSSRAAGQPRLAGTAVRPPPRRRTARLGARSGAGSPRRAAGPGEPGITGCPR